MKSQKQGLEEQVGPYQLFMLVLCVYVLLALIVDSFFEVDNRLAQIPT